MAVLFVVLFNISGKFIMSVGSLLSLLWEEGGE